MKLTARRLNRATLARQLLLGRERLGAADAVHRVVALQAQEPASPYLALWNRVDGFDAADLDRAFARHEVLKATLLRVTLHAVDTADYPVFHEAMQTTLRAARLYDRRFQSAGLSIPDAEELVREAVAFADEPRGNAEMDAWLDARIGDHPKPSVWWAFRQWGPFVHAPSGGPWTFGPRPMYVAAPVQARPGDHEASLRHLVRRYLEGFGPATVQDVARFALLRVPLMRAAVEGLGDDLVTHEGPDGKPLVDIAGGPLPEEDAPAPPRLLGMWDSVLLAHVDRGRVMPEAWRKAVTRSNGDVLPTLLVDGQVAGVWRPTEAGIEATAFTALDDDTWQGLDREARSLRAFLAPREPLVYRRYARWWEDLPAAEVRLIGA